jgi:hypothetical protein
MINSVLTEVNYHLPMGLKVPPGAEKRPPAEPPSPRWRRIGVAQRDELSIVPIAILVFCFAALLVDAVLGGHGRAVIADRIAAVMQRPSSEIAVGSITAK